MPVSQELIQHWILNIAINFPRRLSDFIPFVESESLNVKELPGVTPTEYAAAFLTLIDAGFVYAYHIETDAGETRARADRPEVEAILEKRLQLPVETSRIRVRLGQPRPSTKSFPPDLRWKITAAGGDAWESIA